MLKWRWSNGYMTFSTEYSLKHSLAYLEALLVELIKKHVELRWFKGTVLQNKKKLYVKTFYPFFTGDVS